MLVILQGNPNMGTLPIYDEKRGEYVEAETETPAAPPDRPKRSSLLPPQRPLSDAPPTQPDAPPGTVEYFLQFLERLKQSMERTGKRADAAIVAELVEYLSQQQSAAAAAAEAEHENKPIFAVAAAYMTALTTIVSVDEATAARSLARKLISLGYDLPKKGGGHPRLEAPGDLAGPARAPSARSGHERHLQARPRVRAPGPLEDGPRRCARARRASRRVNTSGVTPDCAGGLPAHFAHSAACFHVVAWGFGFALWRSSVNSSRSRRLLRQS